MFVDMIDLRYLKWAVGTSFVQSKEECLERETPSKTLNMAK